MTDTYTELNNIRYAVLNAANDLRDWTVRDDENYRYVAYPSWPAKIEQAIDDLDDAARQLLEVVQELR
jgi:hypothetical protein